MKKLLLLGVLAVLVLVAVIVSLLFRTDTSQVESLSTAPITTSSTVLLQPLAAEVFLFDHSLSDWSAITAETPLQDGAQIKTSATGRALVTRDTELVTSINSNSEMTLSLSEDQKSNILKLIAGETWTKITRALEQDEIYEVHTPTMVAAVRGTSFGVSTEPASQIIVTEGTVWASLIDPETGEVDESTTVVVPAGKIVIYIDGRLEVRDITDKDKGDWYYEHNPEPDNDDGESAVEPESEVVDPVVVPETSIVPEELPVVLPEVTISSVSPVSFDLATEERLLIKGENLNLVNRVVIDGENREFTLTSVGVLVVEKTELPTKEGEYSVTLFYRDTSVSRARAFSIIEPAPSGILISKVVAGVTNSPEDYVEVHGSGLSLVQTVLVNGRSNLFQVINDNLIQVFDFSFANIKTIELQGSGLSATFTQ